MYGCIDLGQQNIWSFNWWRLCNWGVLGFLKAYNTIDHDMLLKKLEKYDIRGAPWSGSHIICQTEISMLLVMELNLKGEH